jgi:Spy/CpxP family protein refolding chaperone
MPKVWRTAVLTAAIAFVAGALGVYTSLAFLADTRERGHTSLDAAVHHELDLSADQERQIDEFEVRFAASKASLEADMRSATREIAAAVSEDKAYTERVRQAVDHFHMAMGELQHATILHVFEMRATLTPAQQNKFDEIVRAELLHSAEEAEPD